MKVRHDLHIFLAIISSTLVLTGVAHADLVVIPLDPQLGSATPLEITEDHLEIDCDDSDPQCLFQETFRIHS